MGRFSRKSRGLSVASLPSYTGPKADTAKERTHFFFVQDREKIPIRIHTSHLYKPLPLKTQEEAAMFIVGRECV